MKLITKSIEKKLLKNSERSIATGETANTAPLKLFYPSGRYTFYAFDMDADGRMFGFCVSALGADCDEWGYTMLSDIQGRHGPFGLRVERDLHFTGITREEISAGVRK